MTDFVVTPELTDVTIDGAHRCIFLASSLAATTDSRLPGAATNPAVACTQKIPKRNFTDGWGGTSRRA